MPTGYTSDIAKGITFKEYAMGCARAFGACVTMRDEPWNAKIPEKFEPNSYHSKELAKAKKKYDRFSKASNKEIVKLFNSTVKHEIDSYSKAIREALELKKKYETILEQCRNWIPPTTEHEEFKKFMISQIEESIDHDCNVDYYQEEMKKLKSLTLEKWKQSEMKDLLWDIEYHTDENKEEIQRCKSRTNWMQKLREALK